MLLYMDRQTLPNVATRVTTEFGLKEVQYGNVEMWFGYAFAVGAFLWGCVADRWSVRWLYPALVLAWSAMGFLTGLVKDYEGLLLCRTLLGFFEAGHWPCALKTTQRLLSRDERTLGNSVLQSGASIGAIITPLVMTFMVAGRTEPGVWRKPFLVIGVIGVFWVVAWFVLLKDKDFAESGAAGETPNAEPGVTAPADASFVAVFADRRFWALVVVVAAINVCWQIVRAWLPKFLIQGKGYPEADALAFNSLYYIATDIGCLAAGAAALWLVKRGWEVHRSRATVFGVCALLTSLTALAATLPRGWALLGVAACDAEYDRSGMGGQSGLVPPRRRRGVRRLSAALCGVLFRILSRNAAFAAGANPATCRDRLSRQGGGARLAHGLGLAVFPVGPHAGFAVWRRFRQSFAWRALPA